MISSVATSRQPTQTKQGAERWNKPALLSAVRAGLPCDVGLAVLRSGHRIGRHQNEIRREGELVRTAGSHRNYSYRTRIRTRTRTRTRTRAHLTRGQT